MVGKESSEDPSDKLFCQKIVAAGGPYVFCTATFGFLICDLFAGTVWA
jgi:hypothetical protein